MPLEKVINELKKNYRRDTGYCAYQNLYNTLSKEDQKALNDAWTKKLPMSLIVRALRQDGYKTSMDSVRAHLKGLCKCPKS